MSPQNGYRSYSSRPYGSRTYVRPYSYVPYRPYYFSRPYYSFRPRLSIGFGLWLGYPVPYPYAYLGGYSPRVFGYYGEPYYSVSAGVSIYGGLSFDIQPPDADLFVDGDYVGPVGSFTPNGEPLTLTPGVHRHRHPARRLPADGVGRDDRARAGDSISRSDGAVLRLKGQRPQPRPQSRVQNTEGRPAGRPSSKSSTKSPACSKRRAERLH